MNKSKLFVAGIFLLAFALASSRVLAYDDVYHYHRGDFAYHYDSRANVGVFELDFSNTQSRFYGDYDFRAMREIKFLDRSFNERYDLTRGVSSGEAFCSDCVDDDFAPTNWRYKDSFDLRNRNNDGNYYKPVYDSTKGYFNWRY